MRCGSYFAEEEWTLMGMSSDGKRVEMVALACKLSQEEMVLKGRALAEKRVEINAAKEQKKHMAKAAKEMIEDLEVEAEEIGSCIRAGEEIRPIPCYEEPDHKRGIWAMYREDSGAKISERAMTAEEREAHREGKLQAIGGGSGAASA
jgi:hypothetical protein